MSGRRLAKFGNCVQSARAAQIQSGFKEKSWNIGDSP